ncbi:hypothetical protein BH09ACT12_BH09ACT12_23940 [soil metagenome]
MSIPMSESDSASERRPPLSRRRGLTIGGLGLALLGASLFAATRSDEQPLPVAVGHIHGIGVDPADGRLFIGAHLGVFSVADDATVIPIGQERNDTMAFTVVGPGRFLASGHPAFGSDQPVHLGLIESTDAANSWESVSLTGESDFHSLEVTAGRTWGVDSARGKLLTSTDNLDWETVAQGSFIDVATDPGPDDSVLATTDVGELRSYDTTGRSTGIPDAPVMTFIDWPAPDLLVGLAPDGSVLVSATGGSGWERAGKVPGQPSALEVTDSRWYAASDQGLFSSVDTGSSWQALITYGDPP